MTYLLNQYFARKFTQHIFTSIIFQIAMEKGQVPHEYDLYEILHMSVQHVKFEYKCATLYMRFNMSVFYS